MANQRAFALFDEPPAQDRYQVIVDVIAQHLKPASPWTAVAVGWSAGKDSSLLLALTLEAARQLKASRVEPKPIAVLNSDTRIESPLIRKLVRVESARIEAFATAHGLDVTLVTGRPHVAQSWAVSIIAGNALPPRPGKSACTEDWKIAPLRRALNGYLRARALSGEVLKLTGTRFAESNERGRKMTLRGESATEPCQNKAGEWILSPLADLETDDVWELLGALRAGQVHASYGDFEDLLDTYRAAGGDSCPLVADHRMGGADLGSCEARTGCWGCTKIGVDQSLKNSLTEHPELLPLYRIREWVAAVMNDHGRRNWIGRTIDAHGYLTIQPDSLSPETCQELLWYCLSADADEDARARAAGTERAFERIISLEALVLIGFYAAVNRAFPALYAWEVFRAIEAGARLYPPELTPVPAQPVPQPRFLHVGDGWQDAQYWSFGGLRDVLAEALEADTFVPYAMRLLPDGREIRDIESGLFAEAATDTEDFWNWYQFILPDWMREEGIDAHQVALGYLEYGAVRYPNHGVLDLMLRRAAYRDHAGIGRMARLEDILPRTISAAEYLARHPEADIALSFADLQLSLHLIAA